MKYYVMVRGQGRTASFTVEPCTEKMTVQDVRDELKVLVADMAKFLVLEGMQPVLEVSEATRKMKHKERVLNGTVYIKRVAK